MTSLTKLAVMSGAIIACLTSFSLALKNANAFDLKTHTWPGDPTFRVSTVSFPSGSVWRDDLEKGVGRWNGMGGMWLEFDLSFSDFGSSMRRAMVQPVTERTMSRSSAQPMLMALGGCTARKRTAGTSRVWTSCSTPISPGIPVSRTSA